MSNRPSNGPNYRPGITKISVTGFKSLANKTDVEIRPLTILAGANSSGKSSLMQPLLLMKQTFDNERIPPGPFWLAGELIEYTAADQFLSRAPESASGRHELRIKLNAGTDWVETVLEKGPSFDLSTVETSLCEGPRGRVWLLNRNSSEETMRELFVSSAHRVWPADGSLIPMQDRCFLAVGAKLENESYLIPYHRPEVHLIRNIVQEMIYVSGLRGSYDREFYLHGIPSGNVFPGDFEDYVPSILGDWQESSPDRVYGLYELSKLRRWLRDLELASNVEARKLNESQLEVRIPRTLHGDSADLVNIADVGLAVSHVLPVLVSLIVAHPNQLVYIEQPELHLQTRAQLKLAQLLAEAANRGVRVVLETHSSLLLRGILTEVAKGAIANDKVMLHWFERDKTTGISKVTSKEPDAAGRVGDWPEDFSDVELSSDNDYLSAVEGNLFAAKK